MTICDKCGYEWEYSGERQIVNCPSCMEKTSTDNDSPFVSTFLSLAGELRKYAVDEDDQDVAEAYRFAAERIESELPDSVTKE